MIVYKEERMTDKMDKKKEKEIEAKVDEAKEKHKSVSATEVYSSIEGQDEDTKVERPTEEAVEQAKKWVDEENRM